MAISKLAMLTGGVRRRSAPIATVIDVIRDHAEGLFADLTEYSPLRTAKGEQPDKAAFLEALRAADAMADTTDLTAEQKEEAFKRILPCEAELYGLSREADLLVDLIDALGRRVDEDLTALREDLKLVSRVFWFTTAEVGPSWHFDD